MGRHPSKMELHGGWRPMPTNSTASVDILRAYSNSPGYGGVFRSQDNIQEGLPAELEAADKRRIAGVVFTLEVVQQLAAFVDHGDEAAAAAVVLFVDLHVFGQFGDALRQDGALNFH